MQTARVCLNPVMQPNGLAIGSVQNIFNRIMTECVHTAAFKPQTDNDAISRSADRLGQESEFAK